MQDTVTTTVTEGLENISGTCEDKREKMDEDLKNVTDAENLENDAHLATEDGRPLDALENIEKAEKLLAKVTRYDVSRAKKRLVKLKATIPRAVWDN